LRRYKKLIFILPEEYEKKALNIQAGFRKFWYTAI
jgi:hypothetical protein